MILPNKIFSYNESVISKFPIVLKAVKKGPITILDLYKKVNQTMKSTAEFISVLDCLYALNKVNYDDVKGVLTYVTRTDMR